MLDAKNITHEKCLNAKNVEGSLCSTPNFDNKTYSKLTNFHLSITNLT